jgi:hypothetical protein
MRGYDAVVHVIENHIAFMEQCCCCGYRINSIVAAIADFDCNLKP